MTFRKGRKAPALMSVTAMSLCLATQAMAQQAAPSDPGEIIVTAQKRSENAQNVAVAISALSGKDIAATGVTSTEDLRAAVPALNVTTAAGGFGLPRIRGVGATGQGAGIENPVAVYVDGVYYGSAIGALQSLFDVDQVAVLKGPQGTLFGRNATGGLIQVSTRKPTHDTKVSARIGYGNYQSSSAAGFISGGLNDTIAVSLSGQYDKRAKGFGKNVYTGHDVQTDETYAMRGKILWEPDSATSVLLSGDIYGRNAADPAFVTFGLNTAGQNVPAVISAMGGNPQRDIYSDLDPTLRGRQSGGSLTIDRKLGFANLRSITAYRKTNLRTFFDPDGTAQARLRIDNNNRDKQFTQEIDLISSGNGPLNWVLGAFYMQSSSGQYPGRTTGLTTFGGNGYSDDTTDIGLKSYSAFADATYKLGEATKITAGLRYTSDTRDISATRVTYNGATGVTTTTGYAPDSRDFSKLTWRLSVDHRLSREAMIYASYNRGFRSGTFVPQISTPFSVLEPEVVDAYELGLKTDLLDRKLRFNVAGYYYDQSAVQVIQVIAGVNNVYNARQGARIYGLDADFTFKATDHLRLFGGINWTHARYKAFTDAIISIPYPVASGFSPSSYTYVNAAGATVANTGCLGTFGSPAAQLGGNCLLRGDASGGKLQNTPDFTFSLGGNWDVPTSIGLFSLSGNYYYNGGFVATADQRVKQAAYNTLDMGLTWKSNSERYYARVWGKNLTNAFYRSQISATNSGDNGYAGAPRTFGVTLGLDF
jgi:iron complex outermembrane receptor protein